MYAAATTAPEPKSLADLSESYLDGTSAAYLEALEERWRANPSSVPLSFAAYFRVLHSQQQGGGGGGGGGGGVGNVSIAALGHHFAKVNPLNAVSLSSNPPAEAKRAFEAASPAERAAYCGSVGYELAHLPQEEQAFLRQRIERSAPLPAGVRRARLRQMLQSQLLEEFLSVKFNSKRFGLDGCEVLIPALSEFVDALAVNNGLELAVMGMAHRGRLAALCNMFGKPLARLFHEFDYKLQQFNDVKLGNGDVKYHMGASVDHKPLNPQTGVVAESSGRGVHLTLLPNPSHLETVGPVVLGKTYAAQQLHGGAAAGALHKAVPIIVHGDASVEGQGVVAEGLDFTNLRHYYTGGALHLVVNNQIGFTTDPVVIKRHGEVSPYCTEGLKATGAPVFHVNADDADAVLGVMRLAAEFRAKFHKDVVVDLVCIRRNGHNELDQPWFTSPLMYAQIGKHPITTNIFAAQLEREGVVTKDVLSEWRDEILAVFNNEFNVSKKPEAVPARRDWLAPESLWHGLLDPEVEAKPRKTAIAASTFESVGKALSTVPAGMKLHNQIKKTMEKRIEMISSGAHIDWAVAEALAFGSLMQEGVYVRLSGQDVQRGTFSHRHMVLHDQETGAVASPLATLNPKLLEVTNSSLSEYGVLGFELGVSYHSPKILPLWEAQFGDFANGAQIIFDQCVSSQEQKWHRMSGLVVLLPHGYDGQGPEHSSARLERFLQMSDCDPDVFPEDESRAIQTHNFQVMNLTTPANYFHALRRQIHRDFRKPLVIMSPKRLLKLAEAVSPRSDFVEDGTMRSFCPVRGDATIAKPEKVRRVIFCSGNVYYDLVQARKSAGADDVAVVTVEQLAPFPFAAVLAEMKRYPAAEVMWAQEEPKNQGAWTFAKSCLSTVMAKAGRTGRPMYAGRETCAATATGSSLTHAAQLEALLDAALAK